MRRMLDQSRLLAGKTDPENSNLPAALDAPAGYGRDHGASGAEMAARQRKKGIRIGRGRIGAAGPLFGLGARSG